MKKVKILCSTGTSKQDYLEAVAAAGGEGILRVEETDDEGFDGLLLTGGVDIHPRYYGEEVAGAVEMDPLRDEAELALAAAFVRAGKPILGICRGCQLLNVYFGGTLCQHLPTADEHTPEGEVYRPHPVKTVAGSRMATLLGAAPTVNTAHHQAAGRIGDGLTVTAWTGNVPEALEHTSLPILAVQWHPERTTGRHAQPGMADGHVIFDHFIALCAERRRADGEG